MNKYRLILKFYLDLHGTNDIAARNDAYEFSKGMESQYCNLKLYNLTIHDIISIDEHEGGEQLMDTPPRLTKSETEQRKKKTYYTVNVSCDNCHEYTTLTIPWSVPVETHLSRPKNNICSNCECFIRRSLVSS